MNKPSAPEISGRVVLDIFQSNGIQPGGMMLFPAISVQFMQMDGRGHLAPAVPNAERLGDHHWSHLHVPPAGGPGLDLSAGIDYLVKRGFLEQGPENRIAYFLTDSGFLTHWKLE